MKVRIFKTHTHARTTYRPGPRGLVLDVSATEAAFLKQHGVLDPPQPVVDRSAPPTEPVEQPIA